MEFPNFFRVHQRFQATRVTDIAGEVERQLSRLDLGKKVRSGDRVAITAGSRGIANIPVIIRAIVEHVKRLGGSPFIVPAMGSHGGGTAEGQKKVLETLGVTESFCGCPILASMETVIVCQAKEGFPVHFDKHAYGADHVIVCGRIKPHTRFVGTIESGLMKMMLIGLGKHNGAKIYHRAIMNYNFGQILRSVANEVLQRCRVIAGLAIIENAYDETAMIEAVEPARFESREQELLKLAREWLPRLPFNQIDLLVLEQIGKDISGAGMDANVVGRKYSDHEAAADEWPKITRIAVRDLSEATHGNATGIGIAEFCLTRAIQKMDVQMTRINCLTGGHPTAAMLPLDYPTDRELFAAALPTIGLVEPPQAKIVWAQNTLHLAEVECAEAFYEEAKRRDDLEIIAEPRQLPFDQAGMWPNWKSSHSQLGQH